MAFTVGILGGGQLARMLALAGAPLGLRFLVLDSVADACAGQVAPLLQADYRDHAALEEFAARVDVATFDFENVPAASAEWLAARVPVYPNPRALAVSQDRLEEKNLFRGLGLATPEFAVVDSLEDLRQAVAAIGLPAILKTRRLGYDGKGQFRLRGPGDVEAAWAALGGAALILERFVAFERELSVLGVRSSTGQFVAYPLVENWHASGILSASLAPAAVSAGLADEALAVARTLAEALDYVGVFALELFLVEGRLMANEMAPRVHNSGHWTIEGAETSQFENHLRAVLGAPLGSIAPRGTSAMLNWVGQLPARDAALAEAAAHWHDYGKASRPGRKVGHLTLRADAPATLAGSLARVGRALEREAQVAPVLAALAKHT
ncbi:MAG TPA: 5-(carboxyamino)imidazole ribonucleotide synthase [Xanthomonadaceae bacterium]|nr:5-(carboxyamino)imidazole ribonucleotide synthase [Xanthomonadaceae bacterium]